MTSNLSRFLQLPTEVRLPIYRLLLPYSEYNSGREKSDSPVEWHHGACPGILFVNRQIHQEAAEILYRENTFAIYVKHPRQPRLPMNEGRADAESFMLVSWKGRSWSNPKNPKLSFSVLKKHSNLRDIRRLHISLPPLDDLLGVDVYMQRSSYAAFHGINGWIRKCSKADGRMDDQERDRITYVQQIKEPIDETGQLMQLLPRIDVLHLSIHAMEREVSFLMYLLQSLLTLPTIRQAECFYSPTKSRLAVASLPNDFSDDLLMDLKVALERSAEKREEPYLPKDMEEMFSLLQSIKEQQQRNPYRLPDWLTLMLA